MDEIRKESDMTLAGMIVTVIIGTAFVFFVVMIVMRTQMNNEATVAKAHEILNSFAKPVAEDSYRAIGNLFDSIKREWAALLKKWEAKQNPTTAELAEMADEMEAFDAKVKKLFDKIDEQQSKMMEGLKKLEDEIQKSHHEKKGD